MAVRSRGVHAGSHARLRFATDDRLVAFVRRDDSTAFEVLYDRHSAALLSFCLYMLGSRHDAEDALQATFASAHKALLADERPLALRPWLFAIARNACLSILRQRRPWVELNGEPAHGGDPVRELELREEVRQLVEGVLALPERQRAALVLAELHGLSQVEIATVMGVSAEQVKAYAYQARSNLISDREARDTHCRDIREELATARGAALLKRRLRRHLRSCMGCREYQHELSHQRRQFGVLLPVVPSLALKLRTLEDLLGSAALPTSTSAARVAAGGALAGTAALADGGLKALVAKVGTGLAALGATAGVGAAVLGLPITPEGEATPASGAGQHAQPLLSASAGPARRPAAPGKGAGAAGLPPLGTARAGGTGKQGGQPSSATMQLGSPATPNGGGSEAGGGSPGDASGEGNGDVNQPGPASDGEHSGKAPEPAQESEAERRQKAREQRKAEASKKSEERLRQKEHEGQQKSNEQRKSEERQQRKEERQRKSEERQQAPSGRPPGLRGPPPQRREAQREERRKRREERRR